MKRVSIAAAASALAFAIPGVALAHDSGDQHHQGEHQQQQGDEHHGQQQRAHDASSRGRDDLRGTVASFTGGVLTIKSTSGALVSGKVTEGTRIECPVPPTATSASNGGNGRGDDNDGGDNRGDQNRGDDNDQFDDRGNDAQDNDAGDDNAEDQAEHCTPAALVSGAAVREAKLSVSNAGAVWQKVELGA
jgi:hypothetical protein